MFIKRNALELSGLMEKFNESNPVFIIDMDSRKICDVNREAIEGCRDRNPVGNNLNDIVYVNQNIGYAMAPAFFNNQWFNLEQETLLWQGSPHIKITLHQRNNAPDVDTLRSLKKMIGFLLHRIRSPLTGIQGYTELIEQKIPQDIKYLDKVNEGINELFELLNELESLENISLDALGSNNNSANPGKIIGDILSNYSPQEQTNITFSPTKEMPAMRCNPGDLRRILSLLIDNAVEHAPIDQYEVIITQPSPNTIKVSHNGRPIPKSVSQELFYPFVTTKARKLGIGLTMALLYAKRYKGSIFLTDNNPFREVSFTFCLPPNSHLELRNRDMFS